ncbi:FAD/NAD(P)-binding domain-containing protein [Streptomyces sp. TM32]|uniref:FAD/NAD(P)-binding protein n=1 Tax=Streptomyces sp. TM32 TaxID=1652669 RepID=UPI001386DC69|nr:FAD/NAD(P)-binding domain-containing protein [Streptomyces sp. TM32]
MTRQIVIVGGGAAAVSAFAQLAAVPALSRVTFVAPGPIGLGTAFGTTDPTLLCNTSVDVTSLRSEGRSDLLDYLASRGHPVHRDDFVPRHLVGQYCRERFRRLAKTAGRAGVRVAHVRDRAVAIHRTGQGYRVELADGGSVTGTDVVFCAGVDTPLLPPLVRAHADHPRLTHSPHPAQRLRQIPEDARVLVLGTKQSAVDAALVLCGSGRRSVVMTSPSGMLPAVRNRLRRPDAPRLHREAWTRPVRDEAALDRAVTRQLVAAIRSVGSERRVRPATVSGVAEELLCQESALAEQRRIPWEDVMAELIDTLNTAVPHWSPETRARVLPRYRPLMSRYISAIPVRNAALLSGYLDRGRLRVAPRYPRSATPRGDGWAVRWPDGSAEEFDHVVCASGYRVGPLTVTDGGLRIGGSADGPRPEILDSLRIRLAPGRPAERIWVVGAAAGTRFPIVNYLRAAAQHAAVVAEQFSRPVVTEARPPAERTVL